MRLPESMKGPGQWARVGIAALLLAAPACQEIQVNQDPELEKLYPKYIPASINIKTKDGKEYFYQVKTPKGDPEWQLTREELKVRFQDLAGRVFDDARVERIYDAVYALEDAGDITALIDLCVKKDA